MSWSLSWTSPQINSLKCLLLVHISLTCFLPVRGNGSTLQTFLGVTIVLHPHSPIHANVHHTIQTEGGCLEKNALRYG